jgi:hypothetical protein
LTFGPTFTLQQDLIFTLKKFIFILIFCNFYFYSSYTFFGLHISCQFFFLNLLISPYIFNSPILLISPIALFFLFVHSFLPNKTFHLHLIITRMSRRRTLFSRCHKHRWCNKCHTQKWSNNLEPIPEYGEFVPAIQVFPSPLRERTLHSRRVLKARNSSSSSLFPSQHPSRTKKKKPPTNGWNKFWSFLHANSMQVFTFLHSLCSSHSFMQH